LDSLQITQFDLPPDFIDLGLGDPPFSLLPLELLRQAADSRLSGSDPAFLQYGSNPGDGTFRRVLAGFLSRGYGFPVEPDELFITNGASMGLHLVCTFFTRPGDIVFVEEPTYFYALRIFADHGLQPVPIQTDAHGLLLPDLERQLGLHHARFLYLIPSYQNPSGRTLPLERRRHLADLAAEHNLLVVADEVYHFLHFDAPPPPALAGSIRQAPLISLGSFSKILAPGLRLGWLQASPTFLARFVDSGLLTSGGGMNPFTSAIVGNLIESGGLEANIARLTGVYRRRAAALQAALQRDMPQLRYDPPRGGYFIWAQLPGGLEAEALQARAEACRVRFRAGPLFSSQGGMRAYLRLCFVYYEPEELEEGVRRLSRLLEPPRPPTGGAKSGSRPG